MSKKTKEQVEQEILAYTIKSGKHLFITEGGDLFKVLTFKIGESWYYTTMLFGNNKPVVNVREILSDNDYRWSSQPLHVRKNNLFPEGHGMKSIPNFKAVRQVYKDIEVGIQSSTLINPDIAKKLIETVLSNFKIEAKEEI